MQDLLWKASYNHQLLIKKHVAVVFELKLARESIHVALNPECIPHKEQTMARSLQTSGRELYSDSGTRQKKGRGSGRNLEWLMASIIHGRVNDKILKKKKKIPS